MLFRIWKNTCLPWSWEIFSMMRMHWSVGYSILRPNLVKLHSLNKLDVHSILIPFWGHEFEHFWGLIIFVLRVNNLRFFLNHFVSSIWLPFWADPKFGDTPLNLIAFEVSDILLRTGSGRIHHALSDFKIKGCTCLFANREL